MTSSGHIIAELWVMSGLFSIPQTCILMIDPDCQLNRTWNQLRNSFLSVWEGIYRKELTDVRTFCPKVGAPAKPRPQLPEEASLLLKSFFADIRTQIFQLLTMG